MVNKSLTITGPQTSSTPTAIINGQKQGRIFNITSGVKVSLKYLTITNGNTTTSGGGIYNRGNLTITSCNIEQNTVYYDGGGIYNDGNLTITSCKIQQNTAEEGGGIESYGKGIVTITDSTINSNTAYNDGGGIYNQWITLIITNSTINNNNAKLDGGGIYNQWITLIITNSTINNNNASLGGGIYNEGTSIITNFTVTNSIINNNNASSGGGIYNRYGTLTVTDSTINNNMAYNGGGIHNEGTLTVTDSTINNNTAYNDGGGIYNEGIVTVTDSTINRNTAYNNGGGINNFYASLNVTISIITNNTATNGTGGGINNYFGTLKVTDSNINGNTAYNNGGGINNEGHSTLNVAGSTINSNTANYGGGIYSEPFDIYVSILTVTDSIINGNIANIDGGGINNQGTLNVIGCIFEFNKATGNGKAIYNSGNITYSRIVYFNRFYDLSTGYEIFSNKSGVDARYNWWSSNSNPSGKVSGNVTINPWLVLKISAPNLVGGDTNFNITANLNYDSNGVYHNPTSGHLPDNIPIKFSAVAGGILTHTAFTFNGVATSVFNSGSVDALMGVSALLDDQIVSKSIQIIIPPHITKLIPAPNTRNVRPNQNIVITFSENIKASSKFWIELKNSAGKTISITKTINGNILTIKPTKNLPESLYTFIIHTGAVTDLAGYKVTAKTIHFSVGTPPQVSKVDPKNKATKVARNKIIKVTFNENIKKGSYWIELKASNGTKPTISKAISGKVLTITPKAKLKANTKYTLILHTNSITDQAGNPLKAKTIVFTTGKT